MAEKEAPVVQKASPEYESNQPANPLSWIISKLAEVVNSLFPPPPANKAEIESKSAGNTVFKVVEESKPVTVRFSEAHPAPVPPLKLESEQVERDTNPVFLWQVYAIGGFFILRWALARWKERRANNKSSDEDSPPPPSTPAAAAGTNE